MVFAETTGWAVSLRICTEEEAMPLPAADA